jgi:hypothetical protein
LSRLWAYTTPAGSEEHHQCDYGRNQKADDGSNRQPTMV